MRAATGNKSEIVAPLPEYRSVPDTVQHAVSNVAEDASHQSIPESPSGPNLEVIDAFTSASPAQPSPQCLLDSGFSNALVHFCTMPIRARPDTVYKGLGRATDPPRSVAICPQRKCVAYGCRSGIELYWVDATTGAGLNRWFPLTAPSDFLFFLPQRIEHQNTKKLRLISSAACPFRPVAARRNSTPSRWTYSTTTRQHRRRQSMTGLFFGNLPFPTAPDTHSSSPITTNDEDTRGILRTVDCDHYRAVPLSDGSHVLFIEPATGLLCLGSDAPLGGPTKLIRKVCMMPPNKDHQAVGPPNCYAVGRSLVWGVRIVAAYGDGSIILYSLPADCFEKVRYLRSSPDVWDELSGAPGQSDLLMDVFMLDDLGTDATLYANADTQHLTSASAFKSIQINGAFICQVDTEVDDIQVDSSNGGLTVWIFQRDGFAQRLDIYARGDSNVRFCKIDVDGLLYDANRKSTAVEGNISGEARDKAVTDHVLCENDEPRHVRFRGLDEM